MLFKRASCASTGIVVRPAAVQGAFLLSVYKFYYKITKKGHVAFLFGIAVHIIYLQSIRNKRD